MKFSLDNKVVVITGASMGIGAALAKACAQKNAKVVLVARSKNRLDQLASEISSTGGKALTISGDIRQQEDIHRMVHETLGVWERIDVLINNAGYGVQGLFKDVSIDIVRQNFETNFFAALACTKAVLPYLESQRSGMIVNMESIVSLRAMPTNSSYSATKHALHAFSESMRLELKPHQIHVLSVCPGLIHTQFGENKIHIGNDVEPTPSWLHMSSEKCADKIVRAMEQRRSRITITGHAKILAFLQRLSPSLTDFIISRNYPKARESSE